MFGLGLLIIISVWSNFKYKSGCHKITEKNAILTQISKRQSFDTVCVFLWGAINVSAST